MTWFFISLVVVGASGFYWFERRRHRHEPGVTSFQRHIDALSSERRRESFERVRPQIRDDEYRNDFRDDEYRDGTGS